MVTQCAGDSVNAPDRSALFTCHSGIYASDGTKLVDGGGFTGLTWDQSLVYAATSHEILLFDPSSWEQAGTLAGDLHEIHQILWHDGVLYIANTGRNCIETWDGGRWGRHSWGGVSHDADHINSIWFGAGSAWILESRHRNPDDPSRLRRCDMNLQSLEVIPVGPSVHNIYVESGARYILSSLDNGFMVDDRVMPVVKTVHHLRGLAREANRWYVGLTHYEPDRDRDCRRGDAGVLALDDDFCEAWRLNVPNAGPVYEVRATGDDLAHNRLPFPGNL